MAAPSRLIVAPAESKLRLDRFLASRFPDQSRSSLQRLIRDGHVLVSRLPAKAGRLMAAGEEVEIVFPAATPSLLLPEALPLRPSPTEPEPETTTPA